MLSILIDHYSGYKVSIEGSVQLMVDTSYFEDYLKSFNLIRLLRDLSQLKALGNLLRVNLLAIIKLNLILIR